MIVKTPPKPKTNTAPPATQASVKAPVTAKKETTPVKKTPPPAVVAPKTFRIFLLSWPNRLDPDAGQLALLSNVKEELKEGKYHYYVGNYTTREDAEKILPEIKNLGFKTAVIVQ